MVVKDMSTEDLERKLADRKQREFDAKNQPPPMDKRPDFTSVVELVNSMVQQLRVDGYVDEDHAYYVFEQVIRSMYQGSHKDFWNWWNWRRRVG